MGDLNWRTLFDPKRERPQIRWSQLYNREYRHGDNGHNDKIIIAKLADLLDELDRDPVVHSLLEEKVRNFLIESDGG